MKKVFLGIMGLMGLMNLVGCDKIAPEEYTIYAGPVIEWAAGTAFTPVQRAYVEKYTGPKCPNCPAADVTLDAAHHQYNDALVVISVNHPKGQGVPFPGDPDLRTDAGTAWDTYFGINAIPAAFINRRTATQYSGAMSNITADIGTALQESPVVGVEVAAADPDDDGKVDITVDLVFAQSCTSPLTLTIALTADSVPYRQINGSEIIDDYPHNHMLLGVATDIWGADVDYTPGEARHASLNYTLPQLPQGVTKNNCNIVALVSDKQSREVLNCAQCKIN